MNLKDIKKAYFVGIGGIGMSAVARFFHTRSVEVHGYDRTETPLTRQLANEGMQIHYEEDVRQIPEGVDIVVYTPAVPKTHAELVYFREQGLPLFKRSEVLGMISKDLRAIAIAGTHGKTTTSSIAAHLLRFGGVDATAFLGGIARNFESNFVAGHSPWVVIEADEFDRSFLQLEPEIAGILSTDPDHLDIYGKADQMLETGFRAFVRNIKPDGKLLVRQDLKHQFEDIRPVHTFGLEAGDFSLTNIRIEAGDFLFDYVDEEGKIDNLRWSLPGRHNAENACLAIAIARQLGLPEKGIRMGLAAFRGIERRFELIYRDEKRAYYDDYAHHPAELKAAINASRALYPDRKLCGVFQPHLFSRTRDFGDGFAEVLDMLDEPVLLEIYPAREEPIPGVDSSWLLSKMNHPNRQLLQDEAVADWVANRKPELLLTLGAGDIGQLVPGIRKVMEQIGNSNEEQ